MKALAITTILFLSTQALADEACKALASYEGIYLLESKTCDGPFGGDLTVEKSSNSHDTPFVISSGGIGIGPATSSNSADSCTDASEVFTVQTCKSSVSCLPQNWFYTFTGNQVTFEANGCLAVFKKE